MDVDLDSGKYVLAVSGGVDSVVLLDVLQSRPGIELVVAHFDHGIRPDSHQDRLFVESLAQKYGLPFEYAEGRLGPGASEAAARRTRYDFLEKVRNYHGANAIVTAHHQDDALETVIINMLRGTGRKGMSSLGSTESLRRPLLRIPKQKIINYAESRGLDWREDSTNQQDIYLRNYVRRHLLPKFGPKEKQELIGIMDRSKAGNDELDRLLTEELDMHLDRGTLDRRWFGQLPHDVALEIMAGWLRRAGIRNYDSRTLERLVVSAKTGRPGQRFDVINGNIMVVEKDNLALDMVER
ncbi:MAG TPA: tRNA lysidine(34) synthetase TilS [Candidatus Saccharimonadales bacterium]|nr:tRNA lysidine(34) synthetase TilS [Candidatus Saccharimonadales bacterium]